MKKLSITYNKPEVGAPMSAVSSCPTYSVPQDNLGWGEGMNIDAYIDAQIAHPSIISVMHAAVKSPGETFTVETDDITALYFSQVGEAVAVQGFTFDIADEAND